MRTGHRFDLRINGYLDDSYGVVSLHREDFTWRQTLPGRCAICDQSKAGCYGTCEPCRLAIWWPNKLKNELRCELADYLDDQQVWYLRAARALVPRETSRRHTREE